MEAQCQLCKIVLFIVSLNVGLFKNATAARIQVYLGLISNGMSLYLAYLLYFVLQDFCVVCVSTYIVNIVIIILVLNRYDVIVREILEPSTPTETTTTKKTD